MKAALRLLRDPSSVSLRLPPPLTGEAKCNERASCYLSLHPLQPFARRPPVLDIMGGGDAQPRLCRVFERAHKSMKEKELKEERVTLLNAWLSFERAHGSTPDDVAAVEKQMPRRVKRRRRLEDDSFEEYVDYVFPADDEQKQDQLKMLAMAQAWKQSGGAMSG